MARWQEYISVIEGTAPTCVFQTFAHHTSPCSVRQSGSWSILQTEKGKVGWANVWKTWGGGGCCPFFHWYIYSLLWTIWPFYSRYLGWEIRSLRNPGLKQRKTHFWTQIFEKLNFCNNSFISEIFWYSLRSSFHFNFPHLRPAVILQYCT